MARVQTEELVARLLTQEVGGQDPDGGVVGQATDSGGWWPGSRRKRLEANQRLHVICRGNVLDLDVGGRGHHGVCDIAGTVTSEQLGRISHI